ncbi:hypothetical protein L202_04883 [Cryptococcus amylolentus CBS 6039]|uniref:Glutamate pyruvate transaminase n=3 Tax=Cryptococcus amylolentus TaxID=104669 RepID=A0A1E3HNN0_9TREE|nr:hypothetical protein L202_04883 [Cryptococcus amylolentus CBS 6039]ODN77745.1 hypothetical protein L202_04883 [Cryptococcus amylolentus CBS 6039]
MPRIALPRLPLRQQSSRRTFTSTMAPFKPALSIDTINPAVLSVHYAVRGELATKADDYAQILKTPTSSPASSPGGVSRSDLPFEKIVTANIGNPQQAGLDQVPLTFWRQVISLLEYPDLMTTHKALAKQIYPEDVLERAESLYRDIGSVGAYTHSKGVLQVRQRVAKFIESRDGYPADPESIYLTAGASAGVSSILGVALRKGDGCMIPIPQYPLYTATLAYLEAEPLPYYLSEADDWSMSHDSLLKSVEEGKKAGKPVKALVIINPGNPTGACLSLEAMEAVVRLCYEEGILLLADEVYQANIYDPSHRPFISFKKVLRSMPEEIANSVELVSFHSISKGVSGECGRRGGYFECVNIDSEVMDQVYKMASISLCPPVSGQVGVDLMVSPPTEGSPSYPLWSQETSLIHNNLKSRSFLMAEHFNKMQGVTCNNAEGAMYLFPKIDMPEKAVAKAKEIGKEVDVMYALDLLDATGICAVAGSGFGQEPGTYHLRVTALCPDTAEFIGRFEKFHQDFMAKYA